ncbi:MAG: DUF2090 domain-containing protein [Candidatus Micrarchaeota archaeon]
MEIGYTNDLLILPFDHRGTFGDKMFNAKGRQLTAEENAQISEFKWIVYQGFRKVMDGSSHKQFAGILCDEQYGSKVLEDARKNVITFAVTIEKSGQEEFDFHYGEEFGEHIEKFDAPIGKVLVRMNPDGDKTLNQRQLGRLKRLNDYLHLKNRKFMFELLVPATANQLAQFGGDKRKYDQGLRGKLMVRAIKEIQAAGVAPDIWKLEGLEKTEEMADVVKACRSNGTKAGVIVLGRGETAEKVREWLIAGANIPGVIGFAIGRTVFWDALAKYYNKTATKEQAIAEIANNYKAFVDLWFEARKK